MRQLLVQSFAIIAVSAFLGAAWNAFHPGGYALVPKSKLASGNVYLSAREAGIKHEHGVALFLDARGPSEYLASRIPGSLNVPASPRSLSLKKIRDHFGEINAPRELVVYCSGAACGASEELAERLRAMGYTRKIYILSEGFPGWVRMGYSVEGDAK